MIKCKKCNKEINDGFYNTPRGVFCTNCYENMPQEQKDKDLHDSLCKLANAGSLIS